MGPSIPVLRRTSATAAYEEAITAYVKGDREAAKRALETSLKFDPRNETARRMLGALAQ